MKKEDWQNKGAGHRERLRDKFLAQGLDSLTDAEVVELLLTFGTPRKDCKEPARELLSRFGGLAQVLEAPPSELEQVKGVGPKNGFALGFIHAVARRYLQQRLEGKIYTNSSREVGDYLRHLLRGMKREVLIAIYLDASHGILATETVAEGTVNKSTVYPREIVLAALKHHAVAMVIAHNHPSGKSNPSKDDLRLTSHLYLACSLLGIHLLDHLIVAGDQQIYSFADHGLMRSVEESSQKTLANAFSGAMD